MTEPQENVVHIDDTELKESEMSNDQKYFFKQIHDLRNKKARLQFELDQIQASLSVFENSLVQSTKAQAEEVLTSETKTIGEK
jgi:uncharacterized protein YlxW (UPF0749 family)|tara:strand:- start:1665 stop:1913 length:249 start_codon:yes stop_codon:yes gene_type:complete